MFARLLTALGLISALACAALGAPGHQGSSFSPIIFGGIRLVYSENFLAENPSALPSANFTNNLTFSRGTLATVTDPSGKITYVGNNLFTQSNTFSNAAWIVDSGSMVNQNATSPDGTTDAWTFTASASVSRINQLNVNTYQNTITSWSIKAGTATWVYIEVDDPTGESAKASSFNIAAGVAGTSNWSLGSPTNIQSSATITPIPGFSGWFTISAVTTNYSKNISIGIANADATRSSTNGLTAIIYKGVISAVTYETSPRPQDQVVTGATAYYGPVFDNVFGVPNSPLGLAIWGARTNVALWNRDLTQGAVGSGIWNRGATITVAKDQIGVDGVTNSASSLTGGAVAATNTILQAITLASSARFQTAYVKRLVGTGTVYMTMDGGSTYVDVTSQIGASYARISIPTQTLANPSIGFKIATNGDSIAVDGVQNENGTFATPVIFTGASAVARAADVAQLAGVALGAVKGTRGAVFVETGAFATAPAAFPGILDTSTSSEVPIFVNSGSQLATQSAAGSLTDGAYSASLMRSVLSWDIAARSLTRNGGIVVSDTKNVGTFTVVQLGGPAAANTNYINGYIRSVAVYNRHLPNATLQLKSIVGAPYQ